MKKLFTLFISLVCLNSFAEDVPPSYLKDAVITVTLKDGKVYTFSANTHKVVERGQTQKITEDDVGDAFEDGFYAGAEHVVDNRKKNRITVHGGVGFNGHNVKESGNQVEVTERRAFVFGASYSRDVYKDFSLSGTVLSNDTFLLGVGKDF